VTGSKISSDLPVAGQRPVLKLVDPLSFLCAEQRKDANEPRHPLRRIVEGIATPVCALVRNDEALFIPFENENANEPRHIVGASSTSFALI